MFGHSGSQSGSTPTLTIPPWALGGPEGDLVEGAVRQGEGLRDAHHGGAPGSPARPQRRGGRQPRGGGRERMHPWAFMGNDKITPLKYKAPLVLKYKPK